MQRKPQIIVVLMIISSLIVMLSCSQGKQQVRHQVDSLCQKAYRVRYVDADSSLLLAKKAFTLAEGYTEGKARALNRIAYVRYHDMDYEGALAVVDSVYIISNNQVVLLGGDVMRMKVCQRIGDGRGFYEARSAAQKRIKRIEEEQDNLSEIDAEDFVYASSEYHIITSTYYYYQDQDSLAKIEINLVKPLVEENADTTQLLYYYYMMGSGGLVDGNYEDIALTEFNFLMDCYTIARRSNNTYFVANALQALATRLKTPQDRELIRTKEADNYVLLFGQHLSWMSENIVFNDSLLPLGLAQHSLNSFQAYKDQFQTACVYRTIGELNFYNGNYEGALIAYDHALECVNAHHHLYYPESEGILELYNPEDTSLISIERKWIIDPKVNTVPEWMAGIRQQISMTFSALDQKLASDYNRNIYLDIIESTSQNREMESRMQELQDQYDTQHRLTWAAAFAFGILLLLCLTFFFRLKKHNVSTTDLTGKQARMLRGDKQKVEELTEQLEEKEEECNVSRIRIENNKKYNAERRAKVSLVQAVTPFLDRIINEVDRIKRQENANSEQLDYIVELSDQIVEYNSILTEWIKMEKGELALQISTIQLEKIFHILECGHYAYDQQGVTLKVVPTTLCVKADEALTLFMLNTLADNARKFTPTGGTVTIEASEGENYVELSVSDTGCGLSPEDIDTIVNSKVYDASKIGTKKTNENIIDTDKHTNSSAKSNIQGKKGFGFGLMNCKGIIEKYKKTASLFSVCTFGIESEVGKGSRFYFRLPRIVMLIGAFLTSLIPLYAQETQYQHTNNYSEVQAISNEQIAEEQLSDTELQEGAAKWFEEVLNDSSQYADSWYYYTLTYQANVKGEYEEALSYADSALLFFDVNLLLYDTNYDSTKTPDDIKAFQQGKDWDYQLLIELRNEISIAALALHDWNLYNYNNHICIYLHKLYNQDTTLPSYCDKLEHAESNSRQITALLVILSIFALVFIYLLFSGRKREANRITTELQTKIDGMQDILNHLKFEENRLHVQNQVLDNCLSTIKHESMYYPARIKQLASNADLDIAQLDELTDYYKQLYTLLCSHAERQISQLGFRRDSVSAESLLSDVKKEFRSIIQKKRLNVELEVENKANDEILRIDESVAKELFSKLFSYILLNLPTTDRLHIIVEPLGNTLRFIIKANSINFSDEEAHNLFYPDYYHISLLIVKQIIRDFDAMNNNPGLRLIAENDCIWFTLPITHEKFAQEE